MWCPAFFCSAFFTIASLRRHADGSIRPTDPSAANPSYQNGGEIPTGPRGSGIQTKDGFKTRTPFQSNVSLHGDYAFKVAYEF